MRQGFTLLEILIVMAVMSFATVSLVTSFGQSQERIEFQQNVNELSSTITAARASALNGNINPDDSRVALIDVDSMEATAFIDGKNGDGTADASFDSSEGSPDSLIKKVSLGDILEIKQIIVSGDTEKKVETSSVIFYFNPVNASCDFSVDKYGLVDDSQSIIKIELGRKPEPDKTDDEVLRCLYFHKKSCLSEVLTNCPK